MILQALTRRLHLSRTKRQFERNEAWLAELEDAINSGLYHKKRALQRQVKLRARILALESPRLLMGGLHEGT